MRRNYAIYGEHYTVLSSIFQPWMHASSKIIPTLGGKYSVGHSIETGVRVCHASITNYITMPPKGWRKNAESKIPQISKEVEAVSIDELLFPKSTIQKLTRNVTTPDNMILAKDSLVAIQRAATVFVSHILFNAQASAKSSDRKTISAQDVTAALERTDLSGFVPELKLKIAAHEQELANRKQQKVERKVSTDKEGPATKKLRENGSNALDPPDGDDEDEDEIEDDAETAEAENDDESMDEAENENGADASQNPIALLGKEEQELNGSDNETIENEEAESSGEEL